MEFKRFNSIGNLDRGDVLRSFTDATASEQTFIVQEKVHGANFSFWYDGETLKIAGRNEMLDAQALESFYKTDQVIADNEPLIKILWSTMLNIRPEIKTLTVFGELFGGHYPHETVNIDSEAKRIQGGVHYSPGNMFYAYDIVVDGEYLEQKVTDMFLDQHGFFYARPLFTGSLKDCLKYPNKFQTRIPEWLGLPEIADNHCEGTIIRPNTPALIRGQSRAILKNKNEAFSEKVKRKTRVPVELSPEAEALAEEVLQLVSENRLQNVLSKSGTIAKQDIGKCIGAFSQDVLGDFTEEMTEAFSKLTKPEQRSINKLVTGAVAKMINRNLEDALVEDF